MNNVIHTKLGPVSLIWSGNSLKSVVLGKEMPSPQDIPEEIKSYFVLYFLGKPVDFSIIPVELNVKESYLKVLNKVREIKWGETKTYSEIANMVNIKSYRLIGKILSINPLPIVIPCHRVVSKKGLGGYSNGPQWKTFLLSIEGCL